MKLMRSTKPHALALIHRLTKHTVKGDEFRLVARGYRYWPDWKLSVNAETCAGRAPVQVHCAIHRIETNSFPLQKPATVDRSSPPSVADQIPLGRTHKKSAMYLTPLNTPRFPSRYLRLQSPTVAPVQPDAPQTMPPIYLNPVRGFSDHRLPETVSKQQPNIRRTDFLLSNQFGQLPKACRLGCLVAISLA